jgi:hypothetical protein
MRCKLIVLTCLAAFFFQKSDAQMYVKDIFHEKIPVPYTGKPVDAYEYKDKNGLHIYLVTRTDQEKPENKVTIVGSAYTLVNGAYVKDWSITDFSGLDVLFKYTYTKIVDIDKDGVYETIFVYELDPNDGEGSTWKLMLHYKNQKYALRVHIPDLDEDKYTEKFDKAFDTLPPAVKKYVVDYWANIADEQLFKDGPIDSK